MTLKRQNDVVIKPVDEGGAVVVWACHLYITEVERQLSDTNFYQQQMISPLTTTTPLRE